MGTPAFRRLWAAATVDALGTWLLVTAVPVQVYAVTGSGPSTATALAVQAVPGRPGRPLAAPPGLRRRQPAGRGRRGPDRGRPGAPAPHRPARRERGGLPPAPRPAGHRAAGRADTRGPRLSQRPAGRLPQR